AVAGPARGVRAGGGPAPVLPAGLNRDQPVPAPGRPCPAGPADVNGTVPVGRCSGDRTATAGRPAVEARMNVFIRLANQMAYINTAHGSRPTAPDVIRTLRTTRSARKADGPPKIGRAHV